MKRPSLPPLFSTAAGLLLAAGIPWLAAPLTASAQTVTVTANGAAIVRPIPFSIGGTGLDAHTQNFATDANGILFKEDFKAAKIPVARMLAYPDSRNPGNALSWFDTKVNAIKANGGVPLFIESIKPGLQYYDVNGVLGAGAGHTPGTNLVWLVKHYRGSDGSGYNFQTQYWEVGNEPDLTIDYQVVNATEYVNIFTDCHNQLLAAGLRNNVNLCGPVIAYGYHEPYFYSLTAADPYPNQNSSDATHCFVLRSQIMEQFLASCHDMVDIITYHNYSNEGAGVSQLLNNPEHVDNKENANRTVTIGDGGGNSNTSDRGLAALLARAASYSFARSPGIGVTEHNTGTAQHSIQQGVWQQLLNHFFLYNNTSHPGELDTSFVYDEYGGSQSGYGHYDANKVRDYSYWSRYIVGNLMGTDLLSASTSGANNSFGNPYVLANFTRDANFYWLEVINRDAADHAGNVSIAGTNIGFPIAPSIYTMSAAATPDTSLRQTFNSSTFSYTFPAYSVTVFKFYHP